MDGREAILKGKPRILGTLQQAHLKLDPKEGFLLSRMDGRMSMEEILTLSGMDREEALTISMRLWEKGVIVIEGVDEESLRKGGEAPDTGAKGLSREEKQKILAVYDKLERVSYYELLGVTPLASRKEIRNAYFALSREFHPDRFFRRDIGDFRWRLDSIFKKLTLAYNVLSTSESREEYDQTVMPEIKAAQERAAEPEQGKDEKPSDTDAGSSPVKEAAEVQKGRIPKEILERVEKAKQFFDRGIKDLFEKKYASASGNFRLALTYDPYNEKYKKHYEEAHEFVVRNEMERLLHLAESAENILHYEEAKNFLAKALELSPDHGQAHHRMARVILTMGGDPREAREHALKALEAFPKDIEFRMTLAQVYKVAALYKNALREYDMILKIDPKNDEAKAQIKEIKALL